MRLVGRALLDLVTRSVLRVGGGLIDPATRGVIPLMEALLDKANPNQGPGRKYNLFCCSCPKANKRDDASGAAALDRASSIHGDGSLLLLLLLGTLQAPPEWEAGLSYCPSPGLAESASKQPGKSSVSSVGNSTR